MHQNFQHCCYNEYVNHTSKGLGQSSIIGQLIWNTATRRLKILHNIKCISNRTKPICQFHINDYHHKVQKQQILCKFKTSGSGTGQHEHRPT